ncbi:unnamed protein product [Rhizophagus irregularis]|nr:unnamed protein product [Rhizophagus irregularis]
MYGLWYFEDAHLEGSGGPSEGTETPMIRFGSRGGLPKYRTPKIPSGGLSSSKNGETKIRFGRLPGSKEWKRTKIRSNESWIGWASEERKIKIRSGGLPGSEERKEPRFVYTNSWFGRSVSSEERKNQDSFGWTSDKRGNQDSFGWASDKRRNQDSFGFGWASEELKPKDKDSFSGLPSSEEQQKPRFFRDLWKKVEPRFVWCLGWVPMNRKKPKIHQDS